MNVDFFLKFTKFHVGSLIAAEDFADKFNYQLTPMLIMLFVTIVGIRQYIFTPIQCWIPKEFDKAWEEYTENYCWIQDTYFHFIGAGPQTSLRDREDARIGYYQWVPFVLGTQALFFYLPHILWKVLSLRAGANINQMIRFASDATTIDQDKKAKMIRYLGKHVEKLLFVRQSTIHPSMTTVARVKRVLRMVLPCYWFRKHNGFGLFALYIVIKFVYLGNCTGQLWLMQAFIGHNSSFFGPGILADLLARRTWNSSGIFPRVTWCDFIIRRVGNMQRYSVQCVLPINMLNEKIYIFLWFWMTCGIAVQSIAIVTWFFRMTTARERRRFVKKYLSILNEVDNEERRLASRFINQFLRHDGVFLLRMIAANVGDLIAAELIQEVWNNWRSGKLTDGQTDMNALVLPLQQANKQLEPSAPPVPPTSSKTRKKPIKRVPPTGGSSARRASEFPGNGGPMLRRNTDFNASVGSSVDFGNNSPSRRANRSSLDANIISEQSEVKGIAAYQCNLGSGSEQDRLPSTAEERASQRRLLKPDIVWADVPKVGVTWLSRVLTRELIPLVAAVAAFGPNQPMCRWQLAAPCFGCILRKCTMRSVGKKWCWACVNFCLRLKLLLYTKVPCHSFVQKQQIRSHSHWLSTMSYCCISVCETYRTHGKWRTTIKIPLHKFDSFQAYQCTLRTVV